MSISAPIQEQARHGIKKACQGMLQGDIRFIEGARQILILASDARLNNDDPDLIVFIGITSETDEVPSARMLESWSSGAIAKHTPNWTQLENWAEGYGAVACRNLLLRL